MNLLFDRTPIIDLAQLVAQYGSDEFASPFRSTVPLLALLKDGAPRLRSLLGELGLPNAASLHFEYRVDPTRGKGRPSQTDLMALAGDLAVAIEAKWTEPRYQNVLQRAAAEGNSENRLEVINGWIDLVNRQASPKTDRDGVGECVYQMLHRAASASATASHPALAYLVFRTAGDPVKPFYQNDLTALHRALGHPAGFKFYLIDAELKPTAAFEAIRGLRKGAPKTAETVCNALLRERLFDFGDLAVQTIER